MSLSKMDLSSQIKTTITVPVPKVPTYLGGSVPKSNPSEFFDRDFVLELRQILVDREECEIEARVQSTQYAETLNLSAITGQTTCMIRMFNHAQIIVKYVVFQKTRTGTLTEIVRWVCQRAQEQNIPLLVIESVLTPEMKQWCVKYGLELDPTSGAASDGLGGSYNIHVAGFLNNSASK